MAALEENTQDPEDTYDDSSVDNCNLDNGFLKLIKLYQLSELALGGSRLR